MSSRDAGLHADAVTDLEVRDALAHRRDLAGPLMAEDHGLLHPEGPDMAMQVEMQVAAADADGLHGNLDLARAGLGRHVDVAQLGTTDFLENHGFHDVSPLQLALIHGGGFCQPRGVFPIMNLRMARCKKEPGRDKVSAGFG